MNDLRVTIYHMYRLAHQYVSDVPLFNDVSTCFDYVRAIPYVADRDACGVDECLKRPIITIRFGGDCDDKAILAGACMERMGLSWRIVCVNYDGSQEFTHTYIEIYYRNAWLPFDPTYSTNILFVQKRKPVKIMRFDYPGQFPIQQMQYRYLGGDPGQSGDSGGGAGGTGGSGNFVPNQQNMVAWKNALSTILKLDVQDPRTYANTALSATASVGSALGATWAGPLAIMAALYLILKDVGGRDLWSVNEGLELGQRFVRPVYNFLNNPLLPEDGRKALLKYCKDFSDFMSKRYGDVRLGNFRYPAPVLISVHGMNVYSGSHDGRYLLKAAWYATTLVASDDNGVPVYPRRGITASYWNDMWINNFKLGSEDGDIKAGAYVYLHLPVTMLSQMLQTTAFEDQLRSIIVPAYDEFVVKPFVKLCDERLKLVINYFGLGVEVPDKTFGKYHAADFVVTPKSKLAEIRLRVVSSPGYSTNQDMVDYVAALDYAVLNYERMLPRPIKTRAKYFDDSIGNNNGVLSASGPSWALAAGVALLALSQG